MKPVVFYKKFPGTAIEVGKRAEVSAMNHPFISVASYGADYLEGVWVRTSTVLSVSDNGDFETLNSKYVLVDDDYVSPDSH